MQIEINDTLTNKIYKLNEPNMLAQLIAEMINEEIENHNFYMKIEVGYLNENDRRN